MKLSEFSDRLFEQISNEEKDLELPVTRAFVSIRCKRGEEIIINEWEYKNDANSQRQTTGFSGDLRKT